jgi:uncharacterized phage protein (TIGR01671 family)
MREIKFRAWHKKQSKMIYDVQKTEMVHHAMSSWSGEPSGLDHYFDEEWYELMQYTGLKDKNEKEIYEGDLLLSAFCRDKENPVEVSWGDKNNGWNVNHRNGQEGPLLKIHQQSYEVVGNIFEGVDK